MSNPTPHTVVQVQQSLARAMQPLLDRHGSTGTPSSKSGTFVPTESIPAQTTSPSSNHISLHLEFHLQTFQSGGAYPTARSKRSAPHRPSISKPPFLHVERLEFHSQTLQTCCEFHSQTFQDGIQKLKKLSRPGAHKTKMFLLSSYHVVIIILIMMFRARPSAFVGSWPWPLTPGPALDHHDHHDQEDDDYIVTTW